MPHVRLFLSTKEAVPLSFMSSITCAIGRCRPTRESYRWDPQTYHHVGVCRYCERPIRRVAHRKWEQVPLDPNGAEITPEITP
ncbi:MAG: hypothetical protein AAFZ11_06050 [Pseudomonadota bacterium]